MRKAHQPQLAIFLFLCGLSSIGTFSSAFAQLNFVASELKQHAESRSWALEDMDGDDRKDIIMAQWGRNTGRELLIYLQNSEGRFPQQPSRRVGIKTEIIAVGMADIRPQPGFELLLFSSNAIFSLDTSLDGYAGNIRLLADWDLLADVPNRKRLVFLDKFTDNDNDGFVDLLLPGTDGYGFFRGGPDESFTLTSQFSTISEAESSAAQDQEGSVGISINERDGVVVEVDTGKTTPFDGLIETWQDSEVEQEAEDQSNPRWLLRSSNMRPGALAEQLNSDDRLDVAFLNFDGDRIGQLNLLIQRADGSYSATPDWHGSTGERGQIRLVDLDGDGMADVVKTIGTGSNTWDLHLFRNLDGKFDFATPDQIMRFSGFDLETNFVDLTMDGVPELSVTFYKISVVDAIRDTAINRIHLLYANNQAVNGQLFNKRPKFRLEEKLSANSLLGLSQDMKLEHDIDGDGHVDAIYRTLEGALAAKSIDGDLHLSDEPFWQYVPERSFISYTIEELNGDGKPDIILWHASDTTILISTAVN